MSSPRSLRRTEALSRAASVAVESYQIALDLTRGDDVFGSRTTIVFTTDGTPTFADVQAREIREILLDGFQVSAALVERGRLAIKVDAGRHQLVVDAVMAFRTDGEGLHRSVDPADGLSYVYAQAFLDAAPSIFACFDQPDLKAPVTMQVRAPRSWVVVGNSPGGEKEPGTWVFEPTPPISTYLVAIIAGPYHVVSDHHDGIRLGLSSRASIARHLEQDADELFTMTRQCFDEFHRLFGIRYPFGDYHQAFVPEFNAGAMENPGCVTFRDPLVFTSKVTRGTRIGRATTVAHEMAHMWFGNLTTPVWWDDLWLNESFAEYMGVRVTAEVTEFDDAWVNHAYARRQWGLVADRRPTTHPVAGNGAADTGAALANFDGISYAKGSAVLKQLQARLGDDVFLRGAVDHFERHRFGNATMLDLVASWERSGALDLSDFVDGWLLTAGSDVLSLDRAAGLVRRTPPPGHSADRTHAVHVATADGDVWIDSAISVDATPAPVAVTPTSAVVLDPYEDSWAVTHLDEPTLTELVELLPQMQDPALRAGAWNGLASTFHDGGVGPERVLDLVVAALPTEPSDDGLTMLRLEAKRWLALADDPVAQAHRVHVAARARLDTSRAGSDVQLAAAQLAVATAGEATWLEGWLGGRGLPDGLDLDLDLRWAVLKQMASLGLVDREELAHQLAAERTAISQVAHVQARAALPDEAAKAWAWAHFTGEIPAGPYELLAAGEGMWRPGQEELTEPYARRYPRELPATREVREGWFLGEAAEAFFPLTSLHDGTLAATMALAEDPGLEPLLRRVLLDFGDELSRRIAVRRTWGGR